MRENFNDMKEEIHDTDNAITNELNRGMDFVARMQHEFVHVSRIIALRKHNRLHIHRLREIQDEARLCNFVYSTHY